MRFRRCLTTPIIGVLFVTTVAFLPAWSAEVPEWVVYPDKDGMGTLIIPNAAVLIRNGPNADAGKRFIDYLLRPETEQALAESEAAQMPVRSGINVPEHVRPLDEITHMQVDYGKLAELLEQLSLGFLKE